MKTYLIGDTIGQDYKIYKILGGEGRSGMGIVYICYHKAHNTIYALKTFQNKFLSSQQMKENFKREAIAWISLDKNPYIVRAVGVVELDKKLFITLEYIAPDDEGKNTLTHYLRQPISLKQILEWSIQFCYAMEHAMTKGVTPHRDIKPDNIMITQDKILKITDFGLARIFDMTTGSVTSDPERSRKNDRLSFLIIEDGHEIAGTPLWMAPEQFAGYSNEKSDIYSFGIVLHQMVSHDIHPFTLQAVRNGTIFDQKISVPPIDSPLFPIINRCLQRDPAERYLSFIDLREDLAKLYQEQTGKEAPLPADSVVMQSRDYFNKGLSLHNLGLTEAAIAAYQKAVRIDPHYTGAYNNLGSALADSGRLKEAIAAYQQALSIDANYAPVYNNLGNAFVNSSRLEEAIAAYQQALRINPDHAETHNNLGSVLVDTGRLQEAMVAYRKAIRLKPDYAEAHNNLGLALADSGYLQEAIAAYWEALRLNPGYCDAYYNLGLALYASERFEEAIAAYQQVLRINSKDVEAHINLGNALQASGRLDEALASYRKALLLNPDSADAYNNLGAALAARGQLPQAIAAYQQSLKIDPNFANAHFNLAIALEANGQLEEAIIAYREAIKIKPGYAEAYYNLGLVLQNTGQLAEAIKSYDNFIKYALAQYHEHIQQAQQIIRKLKQKYK